MIYRLRSGVSLRENEQGGFLVTSRPLRTVRLNPALVSLMRRMMRETDGISAATVAETRALETLAKGGFVEKSWRTVPDADDLPYVSVIIPVKDRADDLRNCLLSLAELDYPQNRLEVIVVDDGSSDKTPLVARNLGATLVESGAVGGGPAAARNKGAG
nr:glycosyltransferase [Desulfuromonadales bacterium]NIS44272.1 glycosyltransferase [Desulfuromonadales bacterium]